MGLIHTASVLADDFDVVCLDAPATPFSLDELYKTIVEMEPFAVLIGGTSPSHPEAYGVARTAKAAYPAAYVIKGGPHESYYPNQTALNQDIDYVISGDGEICRSFLRELSAGRQPKQKIIRGLVPSLSDQKLPKRELLYDRNPRYYDFLGVPTAQTRTTRGCVFRCTYCSQAASFRDYSFDYIRLDLAQIAAQGFKGIYWDDALFTLKRPKVFELLKILEDMSFKMGCITRAGINTDLEVLERMAEVGFKHIWFALESGSPEIRNTLGRKDVGVSKVKKAVDDARSVGLFPYVNAIVGSPGETDETIEETINALREIRPRGVSLSVYTCYPGMEGCDELTYENPINRDQRLMYFDEGYGGKVLVNAGRAAEWYFRMSEAVCQVGTRVIGFSDCRTPPNWELPVEPASVQAISDKTPMFTCEALSLTVGSG